MPQISAPFQIAAAVGLALALQACGAKAPAGPLPAPVPYAEAILYDSTGQRTGMVTLTAEGGRLQGKIQVTNGLTPGAHGMHIHEIGKCTLTDFTSAGGHHNPHGRQHGLTNPNGSHAGDLPMLVANPRGAASTTFTVNSTLDALFDIDGAAIVIHADPDDMKTDPTGNSGARVMCGVLYRKMP